MLRRPKWRAGSDVALPQFQVREIMLNRIEALYSWITKRSWSPKAVVAVVLAAFFTGGGLQTQAASSIAPPTPWTPPLGIPHPGFGINEQRPARPPVWATEIPGYYYVDDLIGSDTRAFGRPGAPRETIPRPIPAGSYVEVHGTYANTSGGSTFIEGAGTAAPWVPAVSGPAWIVGENDQNRPTFTRPTVVYGANVYLEKIRWTDLCQISSSGATRPANRIMIRDCESAGDGVITRSGFTCEGSASGWATDIIFFNNLVHDLGPFSTTEDVDCLAFTTSRYTQNAWVLDCEWHHIVGGARAGSGRTEALPEQSRYLYWGRNFIHDGKQNGITLKYGKDVIFSQNTVSNITHNAGSPSDGKGLAGQYKPDGLWMLFNRIYDCPFGIYYASADAGGPWKQYLIGNVITGCGADKSNPPTTSDGGASSFAAIMMRGGYEHYVIGNTIYGCSQGYASPGGNSDHHYIENNIFAFLSDSNGRHINIEIGANNATVRNCIIYDPANIRIRFGGNVYTSLTAFQTERNNGVGCRQVDPLFSSMANMDLRLRNSSPAIGAALAPTSLSVNVYQLFQQTFGTSIQLDFLGQPRPLSGTWDIGAFEGEGVPAPSAPRNLRIIE
jgi:hypothetical protein